METRSKSRRKQSNLGLKMALVAAGVILAGVLYRALRAPQAGPQTAVAQSQAVREPIGELPPYFDNTDDARPFPKLLPASDFSGDPIAARAYQIAAQIPEVLSQQPCYCFCAGHRSLLDCYSSDHAAG